MSNSGKKFEEDFTKSALNHKQVDINRLNDPVGGQSGVRNICDFIVYKNPYIYYLELKSRQGNTLNFKEITPNQWKGMSEKTSVKGAIPGVLINYSDHGEVYFVHISELIEMRDKQGMKSVHIDVARRFGVRLPGTIKRVRYVYNLQEFLDEVGDKYGR